MDLKPFLEAVHKILALTDQNKKIDKLAEKEVYLPSIQVDRRNVYFIIHKRNQKGYLQKRLVVYENKLTARDFVASDSIQDGSSILLVCLENEQNYKALAERFSWLKPTSRKGYKYTFGLGDRLGNASNAHLRLLKGKGIMPVLAQQSIRELILTHRTSTDVFLDAAWAVFEEGFKYGWGADGDHVKTEYEIDYAVKAGASLITLDETNVIDTSIVDLSKAELHKKYKALDQDLIDYFDKTYLDKTFKVGKINIHFSKDELEESVLTYFGPVLFASRMYYKFIVPYNLDLEISMDETSHEMTPQNHFFFANEITKRGVKPTTVAPRFYGEFQKGIDFIGDISKFKESFFDHEQIAEYFGYKLSVHSGSDKLSVYPIIGQIAKKNGWHVKTAGTNWLEACRVIAKKDPNLFVRLYRYAYEHLNDVKNFYVFNAQTDGRAPKPNSINTNNCLKVLKNDDGRQVMHTMFGSLLNAQKSYRYLFRDEFFDVLLKNQKLYDDYLNRHIGEHIGLLTGKFKTKQEALQALEPQD